MLLLHTSDWHLGRTLHGAHLGDSADAFLRWLLTTVRERHVDALMISGDIFDRAVPPVDAITRFSSALKDLCAEVPVILMSGNHDGAARLGMLSHALSSRLVIVTEPESIGTAIELGDGSDGVLIYPIPYLEPDLVRYALSDLPADSNGNTPPLPRSHEAVVGAALRRIGHNLRKRHLQGDKRPAIAMIHAFISGAAPSDSERDIQVGGVSSVSPRCFDTLGSPLTEDSPNSPTLAYVAAGHLHRPQNIHSTRVPIRYSGSPLAFSFSESTYEKSVTLVEVSSDGSVTTEVVPIPQFRPLHQIAGTIDDLLSTPGPDADTAYYSITVTDDARPANMVMRVREVYPHALLVQHQSSHVPTRGLHPKEAQVLNPLDISAAFFQSVGGRELTDEEHAILTDVWTRLRTENKQ